MESERCYVCFPRKIARESRFLGKLQKTNANGLHDGYLFFDRSKKEFLIRKLGGAEVILCMPSRQPRGKFVRCARNLKSLNLKFVVATTARPHAQGQKV